MKKQRCNYKVVGVMSGTSLDGLDLCLVNFTKEQDRWLYDFQKGTTIPYSSYWVQKLKEAPKCSALELALLSNEYGIYIGQQVHSFVQKEEYDFISSHGHTVFHQTEKQLTLQIGNGAFIAAQADKTCICDFRSYDIALHGQAAPLVPIGDQLLFSEYEACLNLGGFANISYTNKQGNIEAFDICPVNIVLNEYARRLNLNFDSEGQIAKNHPANKELLEALNHLVYYKKSPPKSLGFEWVEENVFPIIDQANLSNEVVIATFTAHIAEQLNLIINRLKLKNVLITGGGAHNSYLLSCLDKAKIIKGQDDLIEFKEAIIFAFLGVLRMRQETNVLKSITGAKRDSISGQIFLA